MASLAFVNEHNQVSYLEKTEVKYGPIFHEIVDFLNASHIRYALTLNPIIYVSQIKRFWQTVTVTTIEDGNIHSPVDALSATVDGVTVNVTESSLRRLLQLDDQNGFITLPNSEILKNISDMGYDTSNGKLTFKKGCFSPQWRFLIHTLLHCLSPKKTSYEQFSTTIAYPLVCLATNRTFNFSKFLFNYMVSNVTSNYKF